MWACCCSDNSIAQCMDCAGHPEKKVREKHYSAFGTCLSWCSASSSVTMEYRRVAIIVSLSLDYRQATWVPKQNHKAKCNIESCLVINPYKPKLTQRTTQLVDASEVDRCICKHTPYTIVRAFTLPRLP